MQIHNELTDAAVVGEIGRRLRAARLARNLTQRQVAQEAGVSEVTVNKIEGGEAAKLVTLIRLLRVLDLLDDLEAAIPEPGPSPLDELRRHGRGRQRASSPRAARSQIPGDGRPWQWGDERRSESG
jgi:transcriptional regulator with XRE-family HTH domain